ncbi:gamma-glutamyltransferase [Pajaroellobacter abortibovis]|uniref:gamma-glutamyltransferase n=1 Tax=Pajaroellobacter abortibovis TaxID=1882918 RepID=UPI0015615E98|nr:gamma-glutamyltransferase [Pajaroellobacter abortibovis]
MGSSESQAAFPLAARGATAAVATESEEATQAALVILKKGGNAVDAAITAALALGVTRPAASGLGGGMFALVYRARDGQIITLDAREKSPAKFNVEKFKDVSKNMQDQPVQKGRGITVGVPGEPAGLAWLSENYGRLPLKDAVAPAVELAENGFVVNPYLHHVIETHVNSLREEPALASLFLLPSGAPLAEGSKIKRLRLAKTLRQFGKKGVQAIYQGEIAQKIVQTVHSAGGEMSLDDLASYRPIKREPLKRVIQGRTIYTMGAPSAGGLMLIQMLLMFGAGPTSPLHSYGFNSSQYFYALLEGMRGSVVDRAYVVGDPDQGGFVLQAYQQALDSKRLRARKDLITQRKSRLSSTFATREGGTSHLIVTDAEGNIVSLTTTINSGFGSHLVARDTGILLNDQLNDFTLDSDLVSLPSSDLKEVVGDELNPNRPRPSARPVSSMMPTIIFAGDLPILAAGGTGGRRIATGVTQAILGRLIFGCEANACVSAPRIYVPGDSSVFVESDIPVDVRDNLKEEGVKCIHENFMHTSVQMLLWQYKVKGDKTISAASDPRKGGCALAY